MAGELATTLAATEAERLEQAEALVRGFCGWHIASERTETVTLRARGGRSLMLPSLYVSAVASVTDAGSLLVADSDYTWSTAGVITHAAWWGTSEVVVEFTHGYDDPPAEVTGIVQAVAQRAVDNPGSMLRQQAGPFSTSYSTVNGNQAPVLALLDYEKAVLSRYRIPALA